MKTVTTLPAGSAGLPALSPALSPALLLALLLALLPVAPAGAQAAQPTGGDDDAPSAALRALERKAATDPDDLRAGAEYRQRCIVEKTYDHCIAFFEGLAAKHPDSLAARLNWGYAYVDKIPDAGAVTQVILADTALKRFTEALEIEETWLGLYTRGNSYVYWPAIFGRTPLAIADLEKAVAASEGMDGDAPAYHAHAYAALGDAHWRLDELDTARSWWRKGLERFPDYRPLAERLDREGEALDEYLDAHYAIGQRVETDLEELWQGSP